MEKLFKNNQYPRHRRFRVVYERGTDVRRFRRRRAVRRARRTGRGVRVPRHQDGRPGQVLAADPVGGRGRGRPGHIDVRVRAVRRHGHGQQPVPGPGGRRVRVGHGVPDEEPARGPDVHVRQLHVGRQQADSARAPELHDCRRYPGPVPVPGHVSAVHRDRRRRPAE